MPNEILLIKLLIAHLLGDFFFQPDKWVKEKEEKKARSIKLYLHFAIHGALTLLLAGFGYWPYALVLMLLHGLIDLIKLYLQKERTKRVWFFIDQILHAATILGVWMAANEGTSYTISIFHVNLKQALALLFLTYPASVLIRVLIAKWTPANINTPDSVPSLESAGKYIGIMERLLIFVFIINNHFDAVGFLLAAKSIFRFGDLREGNDLKLTEYILIGTLLSFGIAIVISLMAS